MTQEELYKLCDKATEALAKYDHLSNEAFPQNDMVCVEVDGDWKHDHAATRWVLEEAGFRQVAEQQIGTSDDDWYHSLHFFVKDAA